jgi:hypothetical protein
MGSYITPRADGFQIAVDLAPPLHQIVVHLQAEKEPFRQAEIAGEPQIGVGGDIPLAQHDLVDAARRDVNRARQGILAEAHRLEELFEQDFAGVGIGFAHPCLYHAAVLFRNSQIVMAGHSRPKDGVASARLCPAIHVLTRKERRGCPRQARA